MPEGGKNGEREEWREGRMERGKGEGRKREVERRREGERKEVDQRHYVGSLAAARYT